LSTRILVIIAALLLMVGVAAGAFGAHGLRAHVSADMLTVWQTAVLYQLIHALGLLALAALRPQLARGAATAGASFLLAGIVIFSGSLYVLVLTGTRAIGVITPVGGVCFLIGWLLVALAALRAPRAEAVNPDACTGARPHA